MVVGIAEVVVTAGVGVCCDVRSVARASAVTPNAASAPDAISIFFILVTGRRRKVEWETRRDALPEARHSASSLFFLRPPVYMQCFLIVSLDD